MRGARRWEELPCFVSWEIWNHKNKAQFEYIDHSIGKVVNKTIFSFKEFHSGIKANGNQDIGPPPVGTFEVSALFDASS